MLSEEELQERWGWVHRDLKNDRGVLMTMRSDDACPGTLVAELYCRLPYPLGIIWFRFSDRLTIEIVNMFTFEACRRQGVASKLLALLFDSYPDQTRAYTMAGTELGEAWLKGTGWTENRYGWFLKRPQRSWKPSAAAGGSVM